MHRLLIAAAAGCSFQVPAAGVVDRDADVVTDDGPDGTTDDAPDGLHDAGIDAPPDAPRTWSQPVREVAGAGIDDPSLTADLLELYFNANNDIYVTTRPNVNAPWGMPAVVVAVSSAAVETTPEVSADGLTMMFASDRPGGSGGGDLFTSTRATRALPWGAPVIVGALNSPTSEAGPVASQDRLAVVFTSGRKGASAPDIYMSTRPTIVNPWSAPVELATINSGGHDGSAFLFSDKLTVCFDSTRAGNPDLYCARRASVADEIGIPEALPAPINTPAGEEDPWFSPDGQHLYFYSDRNGMPGLWHSTLE